TPRDGSQMSDRPAPRMVTPEFNARVIERYERSGGRERSIPSGVEIVIIHARGAKTGRLRKTPVVRVEHDGEYALVASLGGAPHDPQWAHNLRAAPDDVMLQDGPDPFPVSVTEADGEERARWWQIAVEQFPPYADYELRTERRIPVFVATPRGTT